MLFLKDQTHNHRLVRTIQPRSSCRASIVFYILQNVKRLPKSVNGRFGFFEKKDVTAALEVALSRAIVIPVLNAKGPITSWVWNS